MGIIFILSVIQEVKSKFQSLNGSHSKAVLLKQQKVFEKNEGLTILEKMSKILEGVDENLDMSGFPDDYSINDLVYFKYALTTSVDVELSFSSYKILLSDNRRAFPTVQRTVSNVPVMYTFKYMY